jgi:hypothetical protein
LLIIEMLSLFSERTLGALNRTPLQAGRTIGEGAVSKRTPHTVPSIRLNFSFFPTSIQCRLKRLAVPIRNFYGKME